MVDPAPGTNYERRDDAQPREFEVRVLKWAPISLSSFLLVADNVEAADQTSLFRLHDSQAGSLI